MRPIIACVPNVSEGRRKEVLQRMADAVSAVRGVRLLDIASDYEQNRSLLTFLGSPTPLQRAVAILMQHAIESIDIREHSGRHPRIGIVDVIPFIPIRGATMKRCVQLSRKVGKEIAESYGVPVFLYGHAASRVERESINSIRSGEYEDLAGKIGQPDWRPDYGPPKLHPSAGAVAVGARFPLLAVNISLGGADARTAGQIAEELRALGGAKRLVKALTLSAGELEQTVAVSILDYQRIPLHEVLESAGRSAAKRGAEVTGVSFVGLVTADPLIAALKHYLGVENLELSQILEFHLPKLS